MVSETSAAGDPGELRRSLGMTDAVVIGLGAMLGAGIFAALAPAARAAGSGLLLGLAVAAVGVRKSALLTRVIVAIVLAVLAAVVVAAGFGDAAIVARDTGTGLSANGVLQAAGLLFRVRGIRADRHARCGSARPRPHHPPRDTAHIGDHRGRVRARRHRGTTNTGPGRFGGGDSSAVGCGECGGAPGGSRRRFAVPHRAELAVGAVVAVAAASADITAAIGFSSFGVLVYYAITNACAWTLRPSEGRPRRLIPVAGGTGCLVLAFSLPAQSVVAGALVVAAGALLSAVRRRPGSSGGPASDTRR